MDTISLYTLKREIESMKHRAHNFIDKAKDFNRENTILNYEGYIQALEELENIIKNRNKF